MICTDDCRKGKARFQREEGLKRRFPAGLKRAWRILKPVAAEAPAGTAAAPLASAASAAASARAAIRLCLLFVAAAVLASCVKREQNVVLKKSETFYLNLRKEPENLHPVKSTDLYSSIVQSYILESFLQRNPDTYEWESLLAEKWEQSADGRTFTFRLRQNLQWSNGRPLTAKDVKFSFDAYKNPAYGGIHHIPYYEHLDSAEIVDDQTVRFKTKGLYFKNFDIIAGMSILPEHIYKLKKPSDKASAENSADPAIAAQEPAARSAKTDKGPGEPHRGKPASGKAASEKGASAAAGASSSAENSPSLNLSKTVIGSGPYKILFYQRGKMLALGKNPLWKAPPSKQSPSKRSKWNFRNIVFRFISAGNDIVLRTQKGDLDWTDLSAEEFEKKTSSPQWGSGGSVLKIQYSNKQPSGYDYIGFNLTKDIFKDRRTRRALAHLMNRKLMNKKFHFNHSKPAAGPWYSWSDYADPSVKAIPFDPVRAGELLKAAGWRDSDKDGVLEKSFPSNGKSAVKKNLEFSVVTSSGDRARERSLTIFQEDLKKAGVKMSIQLLDWTALLAVLDERGFDAANLGWAFGGPEIDPKAVWHSSSARTGGSNYIGYSNPKADLLMEKARRELDRKKRIPLLQEVYRLIAEDVPYIFLFNRPKRFYGVNKRVHRPAPFLNYDLGMDFWSFHKL